jgi:Ca-activated chloride channel homolog
MSSWFVFHEYWIWLFILPPALMLVWYTWRRSHLIIQYWFAASEVKNDWGIYKAIFRIAGITLLFFALLGPFWGRRLEMVSRMGREIMFIMDVSASMNADDLKPTRLEKVKREIRKILPELKGDRVGLIIFTDQAYVQCPLTEDPEALKLFLDLISTEQFADQGTNFREALLTALARFSEEADNQRSPSRCIILISDGENYSEEYASVVSRLKSKGVKLFAVGVGTVAGAQVPNIQNGVNSGMKTDENGQPVVSKLNIESLQTLADDFGTLVHTIQAPLDDLRPVMDQLRLQTASLINKKSELTAINRFQWPLGISLLLLGISFFMLPQRK